MQFVSDTRWNLFENVCFCNGCPLEAHWTYVHFVKPSGFHWKCVRFFGKLKITCVFWGRAHRSFLAHTHGGLWTRMRFEGPPFKLHWNIVIWAGDKELKYRLYTFLVARTLVVLFAFGCQWFCSRSLDEIDLDRTKFQVFGTSYFELPDKN